MALKSSIQDSKSIITCVTSYYQEADQARQRRIRQNRENFDCYHMKQDWSHKIDGQSREFLPLQMMATEQLSSFLKQGLIELDSWFDIELMSELTDKRITPEMVKKILIHQFDQGKLYQNFEEALKLGLLGSLMIAKVHGEWVAKPKYMAQVNRKTKTMELKLRTDLKWQLKVEPILQEDFYPDPTGRDLYAIHESEIDWSDLNKMAKTRDNPQGIYDPAIVKLLQKSQGSDLLKEARRNRVKDQDTSPRINRPKVKLKEMWGTLLNPDGSILMENCVCTVANDTYLVRPPEANPFWHKRKPFVVAPIIRVPKSVWHRALMDAPTRLNKTQNELFNLNLDNGIIAAYGIKQLREDYVADASLIADGIRPGSTIPVTPDMPPGMKVLERVDTANMSAESLQMMQINKAEFNSSTLSNEARMGQTTGRDVKATEVVESSQTITSQLSGVAEAIEGSFLRPMLELSWMTVLQHSDDFDSAEMRKVLGSTDAQILAAMPPAQRFASTVNGLSFKVYGISYTLNKMRDFRRLTALMQTVFANPVLSEEFLRRYDAGKFLGEIMRSLDIEVDRIKTDQELQAREAFARLVTAPQPGAAGQPAGPNIMSQIPSVNGARAGSGANLGPAPGVPATQFPASRATPAGSGGGPGTPSEGIA